jgi:hypothetical protein
MQSVLWIRIGFNADPDPTFCLNADQDPGQTLKSQKLGFLPNGYGSMRIRIQNTAAVQMSDVDIQAWVTRPRNEDRHGVEAVSSNTGMKVR